MENAYALIMAGGAGTRLWPLSRRARPKPLIPLVEGERSMFQLAVERLGPLFPPERILVVAGADLTPGLQEQAPGLPADNFIVEPLGRDTAPAIGLGAIHLLRRDPEAVMAVLAADHHIADPATFRRVLAAACRAAAGGAIVTLGIKPDFPSTGFGYIERGGPAQVVDGIQLYDLVRFREKPDAATAAQYVASGNYSWNSGMFIWQASRVLAEFERHAPDIHAALARVAARMGQPDYAQVLNELWPGVRKVSVDYAIMEHVREGVYVIPVEMGWNDVGNFAALYHILRSDAEANVARGEEPLLIDTRGTLVFSKRLVATVGLEDVIIVDTEDALLVCHRERAQDVKQIVERLAEEQRESYL